MKRFFVICNAFGKEAVFLYNASKRNFNVLLNFYEKSCSFSGTYADGIFMQSHHTHAAGVETIRINETYHNVGEEGPGWSFPEAGKLVLTDANLVSISK